MHLYFFTIAVFLWGGVGLAGAVFAKEPPSQSSRVPSSKEKKTQQLVRLKSWQEKMSSLGDLAVNWQQVQYKALRKRSVTIKGKGYFRKPHYFLWDMTSKQQAWLFNGHYLMHIDRKIQKALKYKASAGQGREFMRFIGLITQFEDLRREYNIAKITENATHLHMSLIPKTDDELSSIHVEYLKKSAAIEKLKMNFAGGNHTTITFFGHRRGGLDNGIFALPKGVAGEVIP